MKRLTLGTCLAVAVLCMTTGTARAQWSDNFDSYALNILLPDPANNTGWEEWDDGWMSSQTKVKDVAKGAAVRSAPHSIWVRGQSDTIMQFNGNGPGNVTGGPYTSGQWSLGAWMYKPITTTGGVMDIPSFFIIQNQYNHNGPYNWSVQVNFSPLTGGWVADQETTSYSGVAIFDQWVEMRADIDLDADSVELFYDNVSMGAPYPWNGGLSGAGSGDTAIGALDLFANGGLSPQSRVYYDDVFLTSGGGGCSSNPTSYCTAGTSASTCQSFISAAGTSSPTAATGFVITAPNSEGGKSGLFYWGTVQKNPANMIGTSSSWNCVLPPVKRSNLLNSGGTNNACDGAFSVDLNARWTAQPAQASPAGTTLFGQFWYRDPANTSNQTTSRSDGLTWTVCP